MRYKTDYVEIGIVVERAGNIRQISVGINDKEAVEMTEFNNKVTIPEDIFKQHFNKSNFIRHIVNFFIKE